MFSGFADDKSVKWPNEEQINTKTVLQIKIEFISAIELIQVHRIKSQCHHSDREV
jgi:hypothetical protein